MLRLMTLGALAALFFSSTFVLNKAMSLEGGHWVWSAALRYGYMIAFISAGMVISGQGRVLRASIALLGRHWRFWLLTGTIGFGLFYAPLTFSAAHLPGWVVATTWQTTILATLIVLRLFGRHVPARGVLFTALIFAGIVLVNLEQAALGADTSLLLGVLPILLAAFAYPTGNQMLWEARRGGRGRIPALNDPVMDSSLARVWLLSVGSIPFWVVVVILTKPPPPSTGQWATTALVALFSGVIATGLFLRARSLATGSYQLAAVDATQSLEVIFSLAGEILLLNGALPGGMGWAGVALTVLGLGLYLRAQAAG